MQCIYAVGSMLNAWKGRDKLLDVLVFNSQVMCDKSSWHVGVTLKTGRWTSSDNGHECIQPRVAKISIGLYYSPRPPAVKPSSQDIMYTVHTKQPTDRSSSLMPHATSSPTNQTQCNRFEQRDISAARCWFQTDIWQASNPRRPSSFGRNR